MNKRQKKKFEKKLHYKKYYNVRRARIMKIISMHDKDEDSNKNGFDLVYIIDSRKMDLKHPKKIQLLKNCYFISSKTVVYDINKSINLEFESKNIVNDNSTINDVYNNYIGIFKGYKNE